jgi:hypothetical protein
MTLRKHLTMPEKASIVVAAIFCLLENRGELGPGYSGKSFALAILRNSIKLIVNKPLEYLVQVNKKPQAIRSWLIY